MVNKFASEPIFDLLCIEIHHKTYDLQKQYQTLLVIFDSKTDILLVELSFKLIKKVGPGAAFV